MTTIHCLGSGLVGSFVIKKLSNEGIKVNVVDINEKKDFIANDLVEVHIEDAFKYCQKTIENDDLYVNMLPGKSRA